MAAQSQISQYYLAQAGGGFGQYYAGSSHQKGYGIGSWLGGLFRTVLPILRSGAVAVGREAARAGSHVLADVAVGDNFKESLNKHAGEAVGNLKRRAASAAQQGYGAIKRRKPTRKAQSTPQPRRRKNSASPVVDVVF